MTMLPMESIKPMNDAEIEAAVRAELPWLLERCQVTGIPFEHLADFMAGGQLASDPLDRLATAAHCELVPRGALQPSTR